MTTKEQNKKTFTIEYKCKNCGNSFSEKYNTTTKVKNDYRVRIFFEEKSSRFGRCTYCDSKRVIIKDRYPTEETEQEELEIRTGISPEEIITHNEKTNELTINLDYFQKEQNEQEQQSEKVEIDEVIEILEDVKKQDIETQYNLGLVHAIERFKKFKNNN